MGLVANGIYGYKVFSGATALGSLPKNKKNFATNASTWQNTGGNAASRGRVSYPSGLSKSAFYLPLKDGGMAVTIVSRGTLSPSIEAIANMTATLAGGGSITPPTLYDTKTMNVTITGGGNITNASIGAIANMTCTIRIGANPSADDIAQAIWGAVSTQFNEAGTMGEAVNNAGTGGVQPNMLNTNTGDVIVPLQ